MNRRHALQLLLAGAAGLALDPERLLWTPKTMITVPAMPTPMLDSWAAIDESLNNPIVNIEVPELYRYLQVQRVIIANATGVPMDYLIGSRDADMKDRVVLGAMEPGTWFRVTQQTPVEFSRVHIRKTEAGQEFCDAFAGWRPRDHE